MDFVNLPASNTGNLQDSTSKALLCNDPSCSVEFLETTHILKNKLCQVVCGYDDVNLDSIENDMINRLETTERHLGLRDSQNKEVNSTVDVFCNLTFFDNPVPRCRHKHPFVWKQLEKRTRNTLPPSVSCLSIQLYNEMRPEWIKIGASDRLSEYILIAMGTEMLKETNKHLQLLDINTSNYNLPSTIIQSAHLQKLSHNVHEAFKVSKMILQYFEDKAPFTKCCSRIITTLLVSKYRSVVDEMANIIKEVVKKCPEQLFNMDDYSCVNPHELLKPDSLCHKKDSLIVADHSLTLLFRDHDAVNGFRQNSRRLSVAVVRTEYTEEKDKIGNSVKKQNWRIASLNGNSFIQYWECQTQTSEQQSTDSLCYKQMFGDLLTVLDQTQIDPS